MKTTIYNRHLMIISILLISYVTSFAQSTDPKTVIEDLYQTYDSTNFLTFDVKYTYSTDTTYGDFKREEMTGTYTMNNKRAKFSMGDVEYMQNDSFFIAVFKKDKMIVVANSNLNSSGGYLPMRSAINVLIDSLASQYDITVSNVEGDTTGFINFSRIDAAAQFDNFKISFNKVEKCLTSISYDYSEEMPYERKGESTISEVTMKHKRKLEIQFLNYRFSNFSLDMYDENQYIWFEDGEFKAVEKYFDYKVLNSRT